MKKFLKNLVFSAYKINWKLPAEIRDNENWTRHKVPRKGIDLDILVHATAGASKTIVLGHPAYKSAKGYFLKQGIANLYISMGFNLVLFDFNLFGGSGNVDFDFDKDVMATAAFAEKYFPETNLFYHGISFGANHGIVALTREEHPFKGAVLEANFEKLTDFYQYYPFILLIIKLIIFLNPKLEKRTRPGLCVKRLKNLENIQFIFNDNDKYLAYDRVLKFKENCNLPNNFWIVPATAHNEAFAVAPKKYRAILTDYYNGLDGVSIQELAPTSAVGQSLC